MVLAMNKLRKDTTPYSISTYDDASSNAEPEQEQADRTAHDKSIKIFQDIQGFGHTGFYESMSQQEKDSWRKYLARRYDTLRGLCEDLTRDTNAILFVGVLPNKKMHIEWPGTIEQVD